MGSGNPLDEDAAPELEALEEPTELEELEELEEPVGRLGRLSDEEELADPLAAWLEAPELLDVDCDAEELCKGPATSPVDSGRLWLDVDVALSTTPPGPPAGSRGSREPELDPCAAAASRAVPSWLVHIMRATAPATPRTAIAIPAIIGPR